MKSAVYVIVAMLGFAFLSLITTPAVSAKSSSELDWVKQFGTDSSDDALGVASGADGVYVAGATQGIFRGQDGIGSQDAYVAAFKSSKIHWLRQFGTGSDDTAAAVAADSSGVYVVGDTYGALPNQTSNGNDDAFIAKFSESGGDLWYRQFGTSSFDWATGVVADGSGVYVAGGTLGRLPGQTSAGGQDAFVAKYDCSGAIVWLRQFGTSSLDRSFGISADSSGVYVVGWTSGTFLGQTRFGGEDAFLVKYDKLGNLLWVRQFGGVFDDEAVTVSANPSGVYVAGSTWNVLAGDNSAGIPDAFVARFDSSGNRLWVRQFGSDLYDDVTGIAARDARIYVSGVTWGVLPDQTSAGSDDSFVAEFDNSGNLIWLEQFGTDDGDYARGITANREGIFLAGQTLGEFKGHKSDGDYDAFLVKFKEKPKPTPPGWDEGKKSGWDGSSPPGLDNVENASTRRKPVSRGHQVEIGGN